MKYRLHISSWPVLVVIVVVTATAISFSYSWLPPIVNINLAVYWFDLWYLDLRKLLAIVCIPLFLSFYFLKMVWSLVRKQKDTTRLWIFPIVIMANIAACASCFPGGARVNEHLDNVYFSGRVYNVMWSYGLIGIGGVTRPYLQMYECDRFGVFCRIVHTYGGWRESTAYLDSNPWKARLVAEPDIRAVSLEVNGEVVYTHHPG